MEWYTFSDESGPKLVGNGHGKRYFRLFTRDQLENEYTDPTRYGCYKFVRSAIVPAGLPVHQFDQEYGVLTNQAKDHLDIKLGPFIDPKEFFSPSVLRAYRRNSLFYWSSDEESEEVVAAEDEMENIEDEMEDIEDEVEDTEGKLEEPEEE